MPVLDPDYQGVTQRQNKSIGLLYYILLKKKGKSETNNLLDQQVQSMIIAWPTVACNQGFSFFNSGNGAFCV